jgi:hypothetical protein
MQPSLTPTSLLLVLWKPGAHVHILPSSSDAEFAGHSKQRVAAGMAEYVPRGQSLHVVLSEAIGGLYLPASQVQQKGALRLPAASKCAM